MIRKLFVALSLLLLAATASAQTYVAVMTGSQEAPGPGDPDGVGVALIRIEGTTVHYSIVTQNIEPATAAHIHIGAPGVPSGPVRIGFNPPLSGSVVASQTEIDAIIANPSNYYVNVHTASFGPGAIRGPLVPVTNTAAAGTQYIPVVGKVGGAGLTNFVTDARIINHSSSTATVVLDYFEQSAAGLSAPTMSHTVTVGAGEQLVIDDIIGFMGASGLGALRVTSGSDITVLARVLNDLRSSGQGTTGFAIESRTLADAGTSGTLGFLASSSAADITAGIGSRTNIGYFNPQTGPVTATFTARSTEDGAVLGSRTITIPGMSFAQQGAFDLINTVPAADRERGNFYVTWESTGGPLFVYAAVVDNETGDSVVVQ
jgi:hypothetical protein